MSSPFWVTACRRLLHMATPELAARVRAAFAFADLSKTERAQVLGVSPRTVTRYENGQSDIDPRLLSAISEATGVPEAFFAYGWSQEDPTAVERVEALEHQLAAIRQSIEASRAEAAEAFGELGGKVAQHTREISELRGEGLREIREEGSGQ